MKRPVLLSLLICSVIANTMAQTRLSLYETFTGEHCVPCAIANPGLHSLMAANTAKAIMLTYPSPFPVGGPIYNAYAPVVNARLLYYGISTAPQGRLDGTQLGTGSSNPAPGHIANLKQADIDAASGTATPFSISISHAWSVTGDSVTATVTVNAPNAYTAPSGANLRLRIALVEQLSYSTAPGINGEQSFPNVVRDMFPSVAGAAVSSVWTMGQSSTFTITNKVARYIDKKTANLVAWIQNDADRSILQAAMSTPVTIAHDVAARRVQPTSRLQCVTGSASAGAYAAIHNAGAATLTSARIFYRTDASSVLNIVNWSGSLAPDATTLVPLPAVSIPGGNRYIIDSVALPNGVLDINAGNSTSAGSVSVYNTVQSNLPMVTGFESATGAIPAGWILYDADSNGRNFTVTKNIFSSASAGYGGSTWALLHNNYYVPAGETNYAILPAARLTAGAVLSFAYAHAPYNTEADKLEVVYSTDCGGNWTSVWSAAGATLSTAPATTDYFIPTSSQWATQTVDLAGVPSNAMIALRATSDYGNTLYIDNVRLEVPAAIKPLAAMQGIRLYPNPAGNEAQIHFDLSKDEALNITLTDPAGRVLKQIAAQAFTAGAQHLSINTSELPAGLYLLRIAAANGQTVKPLSIAR